jgi:copper chaperone CopZ
MTGDDMTSVMIVVPAMYADHHVVEVRRILCDVAGVRDVYASSAFGVVEVDFDAEDTSAEALERLLDEAGYLSELPVPVESGEPPTDRTAMAGQYRRHAAADAPSGSTVAFRQELGAATPPRTEPTEMTEG